MWLCVGTSFWTCLTVLKDAILVTGRERWRRGQVQRRASGMSSEGQRIWSIKIVLQHHQSSHQVFTFWLFYQTFSDTTHPNSQLTHYDSHALGSIPLLIESSHQIKSSFHLYPIFHDESLCFFLLLFLIYHLIHHLVLRWNFLEFPLTDWWAIAYRSQKCCLVIQDSPMYIKRLSCLRERTILVLGVYSPLSFTQQDLKLNSSDYNIRIVNQYSSKSWPLWWSVFILLHQA